MTNIQIAEAFSKHDFEITYPFISDNIQWLMVGGENTIGKESVLKTCKQSSDYLKTVKTIFSKFLVLESDEYITIDSISEYIDQEKNISKVASCDIYKFKQGQLTAITSYCIELDKQK
jgi:hypothetical protein